MKFIDPIKVVSPPVKRMALSMQHKLDNNKHKGGWTGCSKSYLIRRLLEEVGELVEALDDDTHNKTTIRLEAADVCNFAMMLAENYK